MVSVHYTGTLTTDGSKFDSSRDRAGTFEFQVGVGQVIKGWDEGIVTMKKGELCILRCSSEYGYGAHGSPPKIPGGASLDFEVELFKWWEKEKEPWEMSPGEKMATATKAKAEGNESFKAGEYLAALENYEKGLKLVKDLAQGEEEEELGGDQVSASWCLWCVWCGRVLVQNLLQPRIVGRFCCGAASLSACCMTPPIRPSLCCLNCILAHSVVQGHHAGQGGDGIVPLARSQLVIMMPVPLALAAFLANHR